MLSFHKPPATLPFFLLALLTACGGKSPVADAQAAQAATRAEQNISASREAVFSNVTLLQRAVSPVLPSVTWTNENGHHDRLPGYMGNTNIVELPSHSIMPSSLEYCISGHASDRVEEAVIAAMVNSPRDLPAAKAKMKAAAVQWFKAVGKTTPAGMVAAIEGSKRFTATADGLTVEYLLDRCPQANIKQPDGTRFRCVMMDLAIKPAEGVWPDASWNCRSF